MKQKRSFIVTVEIADNPESPVEMPVLLQKMEKAMEKEFKKKLLFVDVEDLEWGEPC